MTTYSFRLLNVFTINDGKLTGNPLCVFDDARGLDDAVMQALALQFNLSETTFILPSAKATARVRIFTPTFEMAFAGHPTLGTAHAVRELRNAGDSITLEMKAGVISVKAQADTWTLQANAPTWRPVEASPAELAAMLDLQEQEMGAQALWVNAGSEQLIVPLRSAAAVIRCEPQVELLQRYAAVSEERFLAYVWGEADDGSIAARFFFSKGGSCVEDPATGSACANLGGWFIASQARLPLQKRILQGAAVGRPSELRLQVSAAKEIFVSGKVIELGRGTIEL